MRAIRTTTISILAVGLLAGSAVGVAAQDEGDTGLEVPSPFLGRFVPVEEERLWDPETRILRTTGVRFKATDPRVSGFVTASTAHGGVGPDPLDPANRELEEGYLYRKGGIRIDNDDGAWVGTNASVFIVEKDERTRKQRRRGKGKEPLIQGGQLFELTGEGGYDGLSVIMSEGNKGVFGMIIPTDTVPTQPEPPPATESEPAE